MQELLLMSKEYEDMSKEELIAKVERSNKQLECWRKMLELYGIKDERMSAALSFAFGDGDCSMSYLESMLSLSERDLDWYRKTHGEMVE
tara:strand:+ start:2606 stop:2872 length:267 start_codon:yes stop_codon:yes gene_type:complete